MGQVEVQEPIITINGVQLGIGHAMTLRAALNCFSRELDGPNALGDDEHGKKVVNLYKKRIREINKIILSKVSDRGFVGKEDHELNYILSQLKMHTALIEHLTAYQTFRYFGYRPRHRN